MNWVEELRKKKFKGGHSQYGEASIIDFIFKHLPPENKFFVDIGAGFYGGGVMSNSIDLMNKGWTGVRVDASDDRDKSIIKAYVTPDNILGLMQEWDVFYGFDFLTIDIDSFDLDILEKIVPVYKPRVICTEMNTGINPNLCVKLKYEHGYTWDKTNKFGYSFGAAVKFCEKHGYKIILNHINQNLFLVRSDLIGDISPVEVKQTYYFPNNLDAVWEQYI
jgi:hypothetical protein